MRIAAAGETEQILICLKRLMKSRSVTYRELGRRIGLSEVSVKRIFSLSSLSVARLEQICRAIDVSIQELARLAGEQSNDAPEAITLEQETALAADPKLLACYYLIANGRTGRDICAELGADEKQVRRWLVKLDALRLVELRSKLRARARTASSIIWRRDGPVRRLYERQVRQEFLQSSFALSAKRCIFAQPSCRMPPIASYCASSNGSPTSFAILRNSTARCLRATSAASRCWLAVRPWVFSMFDSLRSDKDKTAVECAWVWQRSAD